MTEATSNPRAHSQTLSMEKFESPALQTYYANSVDIQMSVYDFVLTLGQMRTASQDSLVIEQQARVIMSPQHMKALVKLLADKVAQYESLIGTIPETPDEA